MAQAVKFIALLRTKHKHLSASSSSSSTLCHYSHRFSASTAQQFHTSNASKSLTSRLSAPGCFVGNAGIGRDAMGCRRFYFQAAASTDASARKVFAPYTVFKGKAALSISPLLPTFRKLDSGGHQLDRRGVMMLKLWPAIGERKYDWDKRQTFALSATEVGSLLTLGPQDSCEFFHDPSMKTSNAGQVRKSLSIKANGEGSGYFFSLSVSNNISKSTDRLTVPLTTAEFAVIRAASGFALPHLLGWDHIINQPLAGASTSTKAAPLVKDLEWDR